ncbi:MAG: DUF3995 domain-containing protein [Dietzia cercidiphylli]
MALWVAAILGTVHAAWSAYWAFGGRVLLDTVGGWAVTVVEERPLLALVGLLAVAAMKFLAAWIPLLAETGRIPGRPVWRPIAWVGGPFLIIYGTVNAAAAATILADWVTTENPDRAGLIGHAFLWDPLFALWGAALTFALVVTRRT